MCENIIKKIWVRTLEGTDYYQVNYSCSGTYPKVIAKIVEEYIQISDNGKLLHYCMYDENDKLIGRISSYCGVEIYYF